MKNIDQKTVTSFGKEWKNFNYNFSNKELFKIFENYFDIFPKKYLNKNSIGFDMGCGTGRWANFLANQVKRIYCIDPSKDALNVAKKNLSMHDNCIFLNESCNDFSVKDDSMDFGYSLGVLHHVPNIEEGLNNCVKKLKKNSPFLLYLYYNFDNRNISYRIIWNFSNFFRKLISKLPFIMKIFITNIIAFIIYYPFARFCNILDFLNINSDNIPLSYYKNKSIYIMKTDSLDRFGTPLENRFSKEEIQELMIKSNLKDIKFLNREPYWVALGLKK